MILLKRLKWAKITALLISVSIVTLITSIGLLGFIAHTEMNQIRADGGYYAIDTGKKNKFDLPTLKWVEVE